MGVSDIPLFTALTGKMKWHQARQGLLAENVANAETPGYRGSDLKAFAFEEHIRNLSASRIAAAVTNPAHITIAGTDTDDFGGRQVNSFEITPDGNGVTLEDEMMKVTANQIDYQTVTSLYTKSLQIIRTALGRRS